MADELAHMTDVKPETLLALATRLATGPDNVVNTALRDQHLATFTAAAQLMDEVKTVRVARQHAGSYGSYYALTSDWVSTKPDNFTLEGMNLRAHLPYDYTTKLANGKPANVMVAPEAPREDRAREIAMTDPRPFPLTTDANRQVASVVGNMLGIFGSDYHFNPVESKFAAAVTHVLTRGEIARTGTPVRR